MKVLLSWLREYAPDIDGDPAELGEQLSDLGLAVEEMELIGEGLDGVQGRAALAELDPRDGRRGDLGALGEGLLREPGALPDLAQADAEGLRAHDAGLGGERMQGARRGRGSSMVACTRVRSG